MNLQLPATQAGNSPKNSMVDFGTKQEFSQRDAAVSNDKPRFNETLDKTMQAQRQARADDRSTSRSEASSARMHEKDKEKAAFGGNEHSDKGAASESGQAANSPAANTPADSTSVDNSQEGQNQAATASTDQSPGKEQPETTEPVTSAEADETANVPATDLTTSATADIPSPLLNGTSRAGAGPLSRAEASVLSMQNGIPPLAEFPLSVHGEFSAATQGGVLHASQSPSTGLGLTDPLMQTLTTGTAIGSTLNADKVIDASQSESPLSALVKYFAKQRETVSQPASLHASTDALDTTETEDAGQTLRAESQAKPAVENNLLNSKNPNAGLLLSNPMQAQNNMLKLATGESFPSFNLDVNQAKAGEAADTVKSVASGFNQLAASTSALTAHTGKPTFPVNVSFGRPEWAGMVAERSAMMAAQSIKYAELQLDPPELGPLQVKVTVNQDQQASVTFVSANPQVRDALDQSAARLREMLQEQGVDLVNVDVSDHSSDAYREETASGGKGLSGEQNPADEEPATQTWWVNDSSGVDYYV